MSTRRTLTAAALATSGLLGLAGPAQAHVSPSERTAPAGSYLTFALRVPHGCTEDGNTTKVEVQIPDGITSVTPEVVAGWTIARTLEPLDPPIDDGEGGQITERTSVITWTGGPLAHDQLEQFGLSVKLPDEPGTILFPTIQTCDNGQSTAWIEATPAGGAEPEHPAPAIEVTAATEDEHGDGDDAASASVDDDEDEDEDEGDGATTALAVTGIGLGAVGIVLGGSALRRARTS
jgi:uncharacterized protein YcnI